MFPMKDPQKFMQAIEKTAKVMEKLSLIMEVLPPFEVRVLKLKDKEYVAILIERKPKQ